MGIRSIIEVRANERKGCHEEDKKKKKKKIGRDFLPPLKRNKKPVGRNLLVPHKR